MLLAYSYAYNLLLKLYHEINSNHSTYTIVLLAMLC